MNRSGESSSSSLVDSRCRHLPVGQAMLGRRVKAASELQTRVNEMPWQDVSGTRGGEVAWWEQAARENPRGRALRGGTLVTRIKNPHPAFGHPLPAGEGFSWERGKEWNHLRSKSAWLEPDLTSKVSGSLMYLGGKRKVCLRIGPASESSPAEA